MKGFKERSKKQFIEQYKRFECSQVDCWACGAREVEYSQRGQE